MEGEKVEHLYLFVGGYIIVKGCFNDIGLS